MASADVKNAATPNGDSNHLISGEELAQAKSDLTGSDAGSDGEQEALADEDGNFEVTAAEVDQIKAELASEYPDDYTFFSDAYISSVASKPYSKDPTKRRPLDYSIQKLSEVLQWRKESTASDIINLLNLANGPVTAPEAVANPQRLKRAQALAVALNNGSQYFHGLTKEGQPILWVRTNRKFWYPDVDAELKALLILVDAGIAAMPKGVTEFVVVSDSTSPPPPNPSYMIGVLKSLVKGFPDRLGFLISAPVSSIIQFVMGILTPLMPGRLNKKFILTDVPTMCEKLVEILPNGKDDIPVHFGGTLDHDEFYPEDYYSKNWGEGNLKFDYFGMVERLKKAKEEFEAKQE